MSGSEAAVHEARTLFEDNETDCILLVDAENAFNNLNRQVALHNIQVLCPIVAKFAINLYRGANSPFTGNNELSGEEGVTQGDPFSMIFYGLSVIPLIYSHGIKCRTAWFADNSRGGGKLFGVNAWLNFLSAEGPAHGYCPKAEKTYLIVKESLVNEAKTMFAGSGAKITSERKKGIWAALSELRSSTRASVKIWLPNSPR